MANPPEDSNVLVFRDNQGAPVAVPADVVTEAERAYRCHQLRVKGMSWDQIAINEGYPSAGSAKYDVARYLETGKALVVESSQREMLSLEVARLDQLQLALWKKAMDGHVPSVTACIAIVMNRSRLVGLDSNQMHEELASGPTTLVVPMDEDGYTKALQSAAGAAEVIQPDPDKGA